MRSLLKLIPWETVSEISMQVYWEVPSGACWAGTEGGPGSEPAKLGVTSGNSGPLGLRAAQQGTQAELPKASAPQNRGVRQ